MKTIQKHSHNTTVTFYTQGYKVNMYYRQSALFALEKETTKNPKAETKNSMFLKSSFPSHIFPAVLLILEKLVFYHFVILIPVFSKISFSNCWLSSEV